nr:glycosyltransferase [Dehalococcoidia bacterium]
DHRLFRPLPHRNRFGYPYILFVGSEHPRKNLSTLLTAFKKLKGGKQFRDLKLVKVGRAGGLEADFRGQTMKVVAALDLHREVVFTEFVPEEELPVYYFNAECFVFPSLYEGFGFPPLEAMACGCPVVTSNTSSLPEVVGDAAIMVDPYDVDGLTNAMREVLTNDGLREAMIEKGLAQAKKFSWDKTAEKTLEVYERLEAFDGLGAILQTEVGFSRQVHQ